MLTFLLYNCGLELLDSLPEKLLKHSALKNDLKKRGKKPSEVMLDLVIHQPAFSSKDQLNRGRPDIVHQCILQFLFSSLIHPSLNQEQLKIELVIHTIANKYFQVLPSWRPPVHYLRFRGLLERLLKKRRLKVSEDEEIELFSGSVSQIIKKLRPSTILLFSSNGKNDPLSLHNFADLIASYYNKTDSTLCLIGGYQHGKTPDQIFTQIKENKVPIVEVALEGGRLPSWKVLSLAMQGIEWNISA